MKPYVVLTDDSSQNYFDFTITNPQENSMLPHMTATYYVTSTLDLFPLVTGYWYIDVEILCPADWGGVSYDRLTTVESHFTYDLA